MNHKKRILLIAPKLEEGGAEKIFRILIKHLNPQFFDIYVAVITHKSDFFEEIPSYVNKAFLGISRTRYSLFHIYKFIKQHRPDVVLSFNVSHLNIWMGLLKLFLGNKITLIGRETTILSIQNKEYGWLTKYTVNSLYKLLYSKMDKIIALSTFMMKDLQTNYKIPKEKLTIIPNPIDLNKISEKSKEFIITLPKERFNIITVGRIANVKRLDYLIQALAKANNPKIHLTIIGQEMEAEKGLLNKLHLLASALNVDNQITWLGFQSNPYPYMIQADILTITSLYEGYSNVIIEALGLGLPVLAFDAPGGIQDILKHNINGILVPNSDIDAFADELKTIHLRTWDKESIKNTIIANNSMEVIIQQYENTLLSV